jgi:hypothetical protein
VHQQSGKKEGASTYLECIAARVVGNFCERIEEMVSGRFSLKADGVEELEGSDGDGALGDIGCHGVPAVGEKLLPVRLGATASILTKVDRNGVEAVRRDDNEFLPPRMSMRAASVVRVFKLHLQAKLA